MIRLTDSGKFKIAESNHGAKVLVLDSQTYAWVVAPGIGSLLIFSENPNTAVDVLSSGQYRLYEVSNEADLASPIHLELQVSDHAWQGYLLLGGLPDSYDTRKRMLPTEEVISDTALFDVESTEHSNRRLEGAV